MRAFNYISVLYKLFIFCPLENVRRVGVRINKSVAPLAQWWPDQNCKSKFCRPKGNLCHENGISLATLCIFTHCV